jgi:hypothetical protein
MFSLARAADVDFGSKGDFAALPGYFRFSSSNRHRSCVSAGPFWANNGSRALALAR